MRLTCLVLACASLASAQTADEIMARVAANQDASSAARAKYVYHQNLLVRMKRANGRLAREEVRDYTVTPAEKGSKRELVKLAGKVGVSKDKTIEYTDPKYQRNGHDVDGQIVQQMADDFGNEKESKDGVDKDLFPLTTKSLKIHQFTLAGSEKFDGRDVWHISFEPPNKAGVFDDDDGDCMAGDAYVDKTEYQPVMISTYLKCKIPMAVKVTLGTNVQHVGFKVTYKKFEDGVWFPVTYGGEFKFRVLFMYAREVGVGLINSDFKRAGAESSVTYEQPEATQ
jgi:hypothetical protein